VSRALCAIDDRAATAPRPRRDPGAVFHGWNSTNGKTSDATRSSQLSVATKTGNQCE
jgi:hypothetical protein